MKEKFEALKSKNETELRKLLAEDREKLRDLRFRVSAATEKGVRKIRMIRVRIARALTAIAQNKG